jgi:predicted transcriptional regulator
MPTLVRLEPSVVAKLDALAEKTDRSRASVIHIAVESMLDKHGSQLEAAAHG